MKTFAACALLFACTLTPRALPQQPTNTDARSAEIIRLLDLKPLLKESGYLGIIGRSAQQVQVHGRPLAVQSQNYYMLTRDLPINYLHWLAPDDTHILLEGGPVDYYLFHPDGRVEIQVLGMDLAHGQRPVVAVPGGCWKALRLHKGAAYALMANALSPEFTPDRVRIGEGRAWIKRFANQAPWATESTLRELIGPNWQPEQSSLPCPSSTITPCLKSSSASTPSISSVASRSSPSSSSTPGSASTSPALR